MSNKITRAKSALCFRNNGFKVEPRRQNSVYLSEVPLSESVISIQKHLEHPNKDSHCLKKSHRSNSTLTSTSALWRIISSADSNHALSKYGGNMNQPIKINLMEKTDRMAMKRQEQELTYRSLNHNIATLQASRRTDLKRSKNANHISSSILKILGIWEQDRVLEELRYRRKMLKLRSKNK